MTEKLYYADSHIWEFTARVTACSQGKKGFLVELDRTAFFPEGGGQPADTGFIGEAAVWDVHERDGRILHYTHIALEPGAEYECRLDREQRLRRMQNHSGEHVVSGLVHAMYGFENVGFHMGEDCMTIDFSGELDEEQLAEVEKRANETVRANLPVNCFFPEGEELERLEYRSKLELTENVRIVEIGGVDRCACCAPHVARTGEIGMIKLIEHSRHRGGVRVTLVCGMDALDYANQLQSGVFAVSRLLSAKRHETAKAVERLLAEQAKNKERSDRLGMELAALKAAAFGETHGNICVFDNVLDEVALRELVNLLSEKCGGFAAAFSGNDQEGYRYIIGSRTKNLRELSKEINQGIGGKGGGSPEMLQGRATKTAQDIKFFISDMDV